MAINIETKDICKIILALEEKTAELYNKLYNKAKDNGAKKVFLKLYNEEIMLKDSYSNLFNNLPDERNYSMTFDIQPFDYTNLFEGFKASWWISKDGSLEISANIQMKILSYLKKLKASFPNLAEDILNDVISEEQRQLEYILSTHYLSLVNNIYI